METERLLHNTKSPVDGTLGNFTNSNGQGYTVYKKRWFMLAVLTILNFSNGMLWISFAPVDDHTAKYYNVSSSDINWLSVVYPVIAIPFSMVAAWFIDTYGLRYGIILAAWLNGVGSGVRILSILHINRNKRFVIVMVGQSLTAMAQTLLLPAPPKLAALWFEESHRVLANMIASTANTIGILVTNIASPYIVTTPEDIPIMLIIYSVPALIAWLLATVGVTTNRPHTPPSPSAVNESETFFKGLKQALKSKPFLVLMVCFGTGIGMFSSFTTLLEQIICVHQYSDKFAGNIVALSIGVGFVGAGIASLYVDRTKRFEEVAKFCFTFATLSVIFFALISRYENQEILLGLSTSLFGFFALALLPVCVELGVECTYPVAEATSASLLWVTGQVTMIIIVLVSQDLATSLSEEEAEHVSCKSNNLDMTNSCYFMAIFTVVVALFFIVFFKPEYKRIKEEQNDTLSSTNT